MALGWQPAGHVMLSQEKVLIYRELKNGIVTTKGKQIIALFNLKPLFDDDANVTAIIPEGRLIQDIADERKRLQEKNEELPQFAALAFHDLKEPLRMIKKIYAVT